MYDSTKPCSCCGQLLEAIFNQGKQADKVIAKMLKSEKRWGKRDRGLLLKTLMKSFVGNDFMPNWLSERATLAIRIFWRLLSVSGCCKAFHFLLGTRFRKHLFEGSRKI
ncbi:MAG: hypothetical protein CM15mP59_4300 [Flavobacteriaceae bacterium]|nr:MAG: hypothetical protein CM15mP59_4300 [Flavobacteriaceae bacterium]